MLGSTAGQLIGRRLTDALQGTEYDMMERLMRQVLESGEPTHWETSGQESRERAWSVVVSPLREAGGRTRAVWVGVLDITDQYWARERLTLLNEASTHIGTTLDVVQSAQELTHFTVPRLAGLAMVDLLDSVLSGDELASGPLTGTVVLRRSAIRSILGDAPDVVVKPGDTETHTEASPSARCLATGNAIVTAVQDPAFLSWVGNNPARAEAVRKDGIPSMLCVPIRARGVTLGVAVFLRGRRPGSFGHDDVLLAEELTGRA